MNKKHVLVILACCLIPLMALTAIFVFKIPANSVIYFGILLLCPVLHLLMMRNMIGHPAERPLHSIPGVSEGASGDHVGHHHAERPAPRLLHSAPTGPEDTSRDTASPVVSAPQAVVSEPKPG